MLTLPTRFIIFFLSGGLAFFGRVWIHSISIVEEDLAVGLMWRLLFVPLFHDSSIVGRVLSFLFRLTRVIFGIIAYGLVTVGVLILALIWYFGWVVIFIPHERFAIAGYSSLVLALFLNSVLRHPKKTLREIFTKDGTLKDPKEIIDTTLIHPKHLSLSSLFQSQEVKLLIEELELDPEIFKIYSPQTTSEALVKAAQFGRSIGAKYLTEAYFFVALVSELPHIEAELAKFNLTLEDFEEALKFLEEKRQAFRHVYLWDEDFGVRHLKGINRGWLGLPTPWLDSVSTDLTQQAARFGFEDFVGRGEVVSEVINCLSKTEDSNVLLVGPAGTGRSTLVNYLAKMIVSGNAPESFATKRLIAFDSTRLLAGITTEGELAEKIKNVFDEVRASGGIILYIDEIQNLGIGDAGSSFNLYSLLLPQIESSYSQFLASTEPENYARIISKDTSFARLFTKVEVPPASLEETLKILKNRSFNLEKAQGIKITYLAIKTLTNLSHDLIHDRVLPDSALNTLSEARTLSTGLITQKLIKEVIGKRVNVPLEGVNDSKKQELLNLEKVIHQKLVDQEEAVKAVSDTLRRSAVSLREKGRPIGSFLFVGPTGVGKTELAKILAEIYFGSAHPGGEHLENASTHPGGVFLRFDMSEYQTSEAVDRLLGSVDTPGELTEAVKSKPYCLLLLDEFEKADPKVLTLFLQVLDDGRLTDARGVTVDFTNTIIIATSNAASVLIAQGLEKGISMDELKLSVREELLKTFKPELINRFDEVVIFKPLSQTDLEKIVVGKLSELKEGLRKQGYFVEFEQNLIAELAKRGFDPSLGARPLRRYIQDSLEANLSKMILEGKLNKGQNFKAGLGLLTG